MANDLEKIYLENKDIVYRICRKILRNHENAEDLMQQTFLTAIKKQHTFLETYAGSEPRHITKWLCTAAKYECWKFLNTYSRIVYVEDIADTSVNNVWGIKPRGRYRDKRIRDDRKKAVMMVAYICLELLKFDKTEASNKKEV